MGLLGSLGTLSGVTSARDNDLAKRNLKHFDQGLQNSQADYEATLGSLNTRSGQLAGQNYMGGADQAYNTQLDAYARQNQAFQNQQNASQMLYNQATGNTPSVADLQMQQGLGNANNQAQSVAYSQQGGVSPGLTQRNLLNAQAMQNAQIVGQGMVNRADETTRAQQMYNQSLGNITNAASGLGQTAQGLTGTQQNLGQFMYTQGQNDLGFQQTNANNINAVSTANSKSLIDQQMQNTAAQEQANKAQAAALGNTLSAAANPQGFLMKQAGGSALGMFSGGK